MSTRTSGRAILPLRSAQGQTIADLHLWSTLKGEEDPKTETSSLFLLTAAEAENRGQLPIQLRERGSYLYEIRPNSSDPSSYRLREESGIRQSPRNPSEGWIDTRDFSGVLLLQLVTEEENEIPIATGELEVRSLKLNYRKDYQAMLSRIAEESAALLFDHGSATRHRLSEHWKDEPPLMQQQLEFLRDILRSPRFQAAIEQILRSPHRRLRREDEDFRVNQLKKMDRSVVRQLTRGGGARQEIPANHPLHQQGLLSVPLTVRAPVSSDDFDTAENRFVKMMLVEFRDFLEEITRTLREKAGKEDKPALLLRECDRLRTLLKRHLNEGLFQNLSRPTTLPFGSPVLQRKAGYRELYHLWLQFHANAQLAWDGGKELWKGGARNVASLYEYWLFFVLVDVFRKKFTCPQDLPSWLIEVRKGIPHMKLKRGEGLVSEESEYRTSSGHRKLKARFRFNHKFAHNNDPNVIGSWTRGVQPDYTFSIWPSAYSEQEAEKNELMVHVHFDAKYRVDKLPGFTNGGEDNDEAINDIDLEDQRRTAPKYEDLLKMHAYRDAIRRTGGAYVLYPGNEDSNQEPYKSFYHEILPGLGAFAIRPNENGEATGISGLTNFLDKIVEHLCNQTSAYEQSRTKEAVIREGFEQAQTNTTSPSEPNKNVTFKLPQKKRGSK